MDETFQLGRDEVRRIARAVRSQEWAALPGPSAQAQHLAPTQLRACMVKVLSATATGGLYPCAQMARGSGSYAAIGGGSQDAWLAYTGTPSVGSMFLAVMSGVDAASNLAVFATSDGAAASASLTLASTDPGTGDPTLSIAGVTMLQVDEASGLSLAGSTPTATLGAQAASATHAGVVTTSAQTFAGNKTFASQATFDLGAVVVSGQALGFGTGSYIEETSSPFNAGSKSLIVNAGLGTACWFEEATGEIVASMAGGYSVQTSPTVRARGWSGTITYVSNVAGTPGPSGSNPTVTFGSITVVCGIIVAVNTDTSTGTV